MDGIAAIEARVAEIVGRFAPASAAPSANIAAGNGFAASLRQAMAPAGASPGAGVAGSSPVSGTVDRWIADAIERAGVPQSWAPALKTIAQHESSFDPAAANLGASGGNLAKTPLGLMQMLPSTFAAHARPGADILNPVDNLTAAIDYIRVRYGDPSATPGLRALARGEHYRGY
jgi:hypothetical protein